MMFIKILAFVSFMLLMLAGCNWRQTANQTVSDQSSRTERELLTARLHIDGFMKSKSGAI